MYELKEAPMGILHGRIVVRKGTMEVTTRRVTGVLGGWAEAMCHRSVEEDSFKS